MKNIKCLSGVAVSALLLPATSYAQIEEVIVTAQKREQSVLDVPVTMDVVSGKFLEQSSISELDDLSRFLPNVVIQEQAVSLPSFNIRGITDDTAAITSTPRISVYQDGFDISKKTLASAALFDVERIEVLKGPQPTLFGMAAANGAVSILSKRPSSEFELETKLAFYNDSGTDFKGMVNVPISDSLNFRLATLYRQQDGTVKNRACAPGSYNTSGQVENVQGKLENCAGGDLNGVSVRAVRATLESQTDTVTTTLRLSSEINKQPGIAFKSGSIAPRNGDTSPFSDAELGYGSQLGIDRELNSADITVNYQINDGLSLNLDSFYKTVQLSEAFDADGSALRIQDAFFNNDADVYGASARLVFSFNDNVEGFVGASYNRDKSELPYSILIDPYVRGVFDATLARLAEQYPNIPLDQNVKTNATPEQIAGVRQQLVDALFNADGTPISNPNFPSTIIRGPFLFESDIEVKSLVAEVSYAVTEALNITTGIRYIDERRYARDFAVFEAEADFTATLPRLAVNYNFNDSSSLYFNFAEGRRSPVVNPNQGNPSITKAESVDSYDLGVKYQNEKMLLTAAVFMYTYSDYQQSFTDPVTLKSNTVTVGDSDMSGFEATLNYSIDESFDVGLSLGLLDATFSNSAGDGGDFAYGGNRFRLAPEMSGSLVVNKRFQMQDWQLDLMFSSSYQSEVFFESSNYPGLSQDAFWMSDASIKLSPSSEKWQVELYADNMFDEEYLIDAGNTGGGIGIPTYIRGAGRTAGIRFNARY